MYKDRKIRSRGGQEESDGQRPNKFCKGGNSKFLANYAISDIRERRMGDWNKIDRLYF